MIYRSEDRKFVEREFIRMGFASDSRWRISDINKDFEQCNTYPRFLILPSSFKDVDLETVAKFRYFRRIPTAVWRHVKNGCFIVRSSQPTVGWFGWFRSELDENLVQSYVNNTLPPNSEQNNDYRRDQFGNLDEDDNDLCDDQQTLVDEDEERDCLDEIDSGTTLRHTPDGTNHLDQNQLEQESKESHNNNLNNNNHDAPKNLVTGNGMQTTIATATATSSTITPMTNTTPMTTTTSTPEPKAEPIKDLVKTSINSDTSSIQTKPAPALNTNGNGTLPSDNNISPVIETSNTAPAQTTAPTLTSKMLIIDARSYAAAMANRAKGGGCECTEYYHRCEVQFMNLANIHSIRKSFHAIRGVCEAYSEQSNNWVSFLDNSRWLHHISGLLKSALLVVDTIDIEEKSILIHCSDGWDRTPQLVALAEIMLDPHYRTFDGFRALIQREWLDFGHKFADRCGSNPCNEDPNERCPVFLQWLDCVQQLLIQYPKQFEFNSSYLDKINRHTYSNIFGTFSYNSTQERILSRVNDRFLSLWSYFDSSRRRFRNEKYAESDEILRPSFKVRDLHFWKEVYLPPVRNQTPYMPFVNNIDNKKFYDSLYIDGLTRTVCK